MAITYKSIYNQDNKSTLTPSQIKKALLSGRVVSLFQRGVAFKLIDGKLYCYDPSIAKHPTTSGFDLDEFCTYPWFVIQIGYTSSFKRNYPKFRFIVKN